MATDAISTAIKIIKFIKEWHESYKGSQSAVVQMMGTISVLEGALKSIDTAVYDNLKSPLMVLVDCLGETKEILVAHKKKLNKVLNFLFPAKVIEELQEKETRIQQLVSILTLAVTATHLQSSSKKDQKEDNKEETKEEKKKEEKIPTTMDFIKDEEAKKFWQTSFGEKEYNVEWSVLEKALVAKYKEYLDAEALTDLRCLLDNIKTGHVSCHRLSDFCGDESLSIVLRAYTEKRNVIARPQGTAAGAPPALPAKEESSTVALPLLLWIDDCPENNDGEIEFAKKHGVNVVALHSTAEAKQWMNDHIEVLDEEDPKKLRIITDNAREGADTILNINAGEDIIRFVRGKRCNAPVLVYCGNLEYTKYTSNYKEAFATTKAAACRGFFRT